MKDKIRNIVKTAIDIEDIGDDEELIDSGLLDSLALITLFELLEDEGIELSPTRIDISSLKTINKITNLCENANSNKKSSY